MRDLRSMHVILTSFVLFANDGPLGPKCGLLLHNEYVIAFSGILLINLF